MRGFRIRAKLGRENSFEFVFPLSLAVFRVDDKGSYLKVFGHEWKLKRKKDEKTSNTIDIIVYILYSIRENPFYLNSLRVRMRGGFDDPFYSGLIFGFLETISPFFPVENFITFKGVPFILEIEGTLGIRVLKILKILYNSYKRRRL